MQTNVITLQLEINYLKRNIIFVNGDQRNQIVNLTRYQDFLKIRGRL